MIFGNKKNSIVEFIKLITGTETGVNEAKKFLDLCQDNLEKMKIVLVAENIEGLYKQYTAYEPNLKKADLLNLYKDLYPEF